MKLEVLWKLSPINTLTEEKQFMQTPLNIQMYHHINQKVSQLNARPSDLTAANLILFSDSHTYQWDYHLDTLVGKTYEGGLHAIPFNLQELQKLMQNEQFLSGKLFLYPICNRQFLKYLLDSYPNITITYNHNDSDYIYLRQDLVNLAGKKYATTREVRNRAMRMEIKNQTFVQENIDDALYINTQWADKTSQNIDDTDFYACQNAIKNYTIFGLVGEIFYTKDNRPIGFWLGEQLQNDMFVIMFAKSISDINGFSRYIYWSSCLSRSEKYINIAQDLGIESLRYFKSSLGSYKQLHKHRVKINN